MPPHDSVCQPEKNLSLRAEFSLKTTSNALWDVLADVWHPQNNPNGFVTLGVADNSLMQEELLRYINSKFSLSSQYLLLNDTITGSVRLKAAIAHFLNRYFSPAKAVTPSQLITTNGVASAVEHCSWAFCDPGEGVLVGRPFFRGFSRDVCLRPGAKLVPVSFDGLDPLGVSAVAKYEEAIVSSREKGCTIRATMLCNPHNPLGRCYSRSFLVELMKLCQRAGIHLISDEIYALSVWRNGRDDTTEMEDFTSVLSICTEGIIHPSRVHALWGVSKDFGANGVRLGVTVSQENSDLLESVRGAGQYSSISGLSDYLVTSILEDQQFADQYVKANREKLAASYNTVVAFLEEHEIPYARGSNAAFFVWCDLLTPYLKSHPQHSTQDGVAEKRVSSQELAGRLAVQKVHLGTGEDFGSEQPGWFRITFSQHPDQLHEGLKRVLNAVRS